MNSMEECPYFSKTVHVYPTPVPSTKELIKSRIKYLESQDRTDAFVVVDLGQAFLKLKQWRQHLPRVRPFYAMKCNPDVEFCNFLAQAGVGFDCASMGEVKQILSLGVHPSRIVFANPCKFLKHLCYAQVQGVDLMTFDDVFELIKIQRCFPRARLLVRIQSSKDHNATHNLNEKFGCDPIAALALLRKAKGLNLNVVGVCFHVGGLPKDPKSYTSTIKLANDVFTYGEQLGFHMHILDIGGGFHGVDSKLFTFHELAETVNKALDQYFPPSRGTEIMAEPGRYFAASSFTVAVNIMAKRVLRSAKVDNKDIDAGIETDPPSKDEGISNIYGSRSRNAILKDISNDFDNYSYKDEGEINKVLYFLNDGAFGVFSNVLTDFYVPEPKFLEPPSTTDTYSSQLWGPTCDHFDCVLRKCDLPILDIGQWLYFETMGAYSMCLATDFNAIERAKYTYVCAESFWNEVYTDSEKPGLHSYTDGLWKWFKSSSIKKQKGVLIRASMD
ncbi:hypothetical protein RRG08_002909 [Elysia crispata]|uniref:Ornithine decarboxylase n=1 Tax=Elysia crispata TaxID=231223 RepID=A0AAE1E2H5_9GAST|nr:hypothetical protein RRG08_002909 [Elysia crispata]